MAFTKSFAKKSKSRGRPLVAQSNRFVPEQFLKLLGKDAGTVAIGDCIERDMTVLFSDIRDFTSLSEDLTPEETFKFISSYLKRMDPVIASHRGFVDKYIGDAVLVLFPQSADDAVACSTGMLATLEKYNKGRTRAGYPPIDIGIGLATGLLMLGTLGGETRMESTVIGDVVNQASRIEALTKLYGVHLLIGENTYYDLRDPEKFNIRFIDRTLVKGKAQPLSVFEVFDSDPPACRNAKKATLITFEEALAHYHLKHIDRARVLLQQCVDTNPADNVARIYLDRCDAYLATGRHESSGELGLNLLWQKDFATGVHSIDQQHQELFSRANRLMNAVFAGEEEKEIEETLKFLDTYVVCHFRDEERLMTQYRYPFLRYQKWQHKQFTHHFTRLKAELGKLNESNRYYLTFRAKLLLIGWLFNHTSRTDKHFGRFLKYRNGVSQQGEGTPPF